jgi:hypothetical protein
MSRDIPWDKLGIAEPLRGAADPASPKTLRMAAARALLPAPAEAQVAALYVLVGDEDADVRAAAEASVRDFRNVETVVGQRTHPKVLEMLAQLRSEPALDGRIALLRGANDRTVVMIARRADAERCTLLCDNHDRLMITPDVLVALHANPACPEPPLERAIAFLRIQGMLPALPAERARPGAPTAAPAAAPAAEAAFDLDAEIEAALAGRASPMLEQKRRMELFDLDRYGAPGTLQGFSFDFEDDADFGLDLLGDEPEGAESADPLDDKRLSIEKKISLMTPGQKIKLAYLGNKSTRAILIRDRNKQVSSAVVKSGRLSDGEVLSFAGNRALSEEVLRILGSNREWTRKYTVQVALANNPKCPVSIAVGLVSHLQAKDLAALARNRNVPSVVSTMANKLVKSKNV